MGLASTTWAATSGSGPPTGISRTSTAREQTRSSAIHKGPIDSFDPAEPGAAKRVLRGGSYLCTDQYCARYLVGSRGKGEVSSGASNLGFRLVQAAR